jgi:hypothetical protein
MPCEDGIREQIRAVVGRSESAMIRNIGVRMKIVVMLLIFTIPIWFVLYSTITDKNSLIAFARKETRGVQYIAALQPMLVAELGRSVTGMSLGAAQLAGRLDGAAADKLGRDLGQSEAAWGSGMEPAINARRSATP